MKFTYNLLTYNNIWYTLLLHQLYTNQPTSVLYAMFPGVDKEQVLSTYNRCNGDIDDAVISLLGESGGESSQCNF